jgi:hypothetical protein
VRQPFRAPREISPEAAKRICWLRRRLLCWFARNGRSFPWREQSRTPYEVVMAEILLQKTTAAGVARAYSGFVDHYPSWASLAQAHPESLEEALRPFRALEAESAGIPAARTDDRDEWRRCTPHARGVGGTSGYWPLHGERGAGPRVGESRAAPRCQYDPPPGSVYRTTRGHRGEA